MKSKNIIKKLLNECSFEITDSFLKSNKETLEKANITERDFINLYNESNLSWNIDHIDKLNIEMYSSMQKPPARNRRFLMRSLITLHCAFR